MNTNLLLEELLKNSKKFVAEVKVWDEYPKDPSYFALAAFLEKVIIPSLEKSCKPLEFQDHNFGPGPGNKSSYNRRGSNTKTTKLRGE